MRNPWTEAELKKYRERMLDDLMELTGDTRKVVAQTKITCDGCERLSTCECAYDTYNTDGDCIMRS